MHMQSKEVNICLNCEALQNSLGGSEAVHGDEEHGKKKNGKF